MPTRAILCIACRPALLLAASLSLSDSANGAAAQPGSSPVSSDGLFAQPPSIVSIGSATGTLEVFEGMPVNLHVEAVGSAPLAYRWLHNGAPLSDNGRVQGSATAALSMNAVTLADAGRYSVVVTNHAGIAQSQEISLFISQIIAPCMVEHKDLAGPAVLDFGSIPISSTATQILILTNIALSACPVTVSELTLPDGFAGTWSGVVASGESQAITITFAPNRIGNFTGTITVHSDETFGFSEIQVVGAGEPASTDPVTVPVQAVGPGVVSFGRPGPYRNGETVEVRAEPLAGARFARWSDGSAESTRQFTVAANSPMMSAIFEDLPFSSDFDPLPLALDAESSALGTRIDGVNLEGRYLKFTVDLPGRHGFRVVRLASIESASFALADFSLAPGGALTNAAIAGPGIIDLYLPWPEQANAGFFELRFDNQVSLPLGYVADVTRIPPGGQVDVYGPNLGGTASVDSRGKPLPISSLDHSSARVTAPIAEGNANLVITVNGVQSAQTIPLEIVPYDRAVDPWLNPLDPQLTPPGAILRLTGSNFGPDSVVKWNHQAAQVLGRSANGTELFVRLPPGEGQGALTVVSGGARSPALSVNLQGTPFRAAVLPASLYAFVQGPPVSYRAAVSQPINAYAFESVIRPVSYRAAVSAPANVFTHVANTTLISYRAAVLPVRIQIQ